MVTTNSPPPTPSTTAHTPPATDDGWDSDAEEFTLAGYEPQEQEPTDDTNLERLERLGRLERSSTWYQRGFEISTGKVVKQITRG
jgi:hypothetical protein